MCAPDVARDLGVDPSQLAGGMIVAFASLALVVEAPLLAWSERVQVRWFSTVSLVAMAAATLLAALATGPLAFLVALALYGPACGCALALAEGVLVEATPDARERTMTRLTLAAAVGDLSVPVLLASLGALGLGWRQLFVIATALSLALAAAHGSARSLDRLPASDDEDEDEDEDDEAPGWRVTLRTAWSAPGLVAWSLAGAVVSMLDELLVAFATIHLAANVVGTPALRATAIGAWMVGGLLGLAGLDRLLTRVEPRRLLAWSCAVVVASLALFASTPDAWVAIAALSVVGAASACLHPITKARAYAALPGRPAIVNAVASTLSLLDLATAIAVALVAERFGAAWAMLVLTSAPLWIAAVTLRDLSRA